MRIQSLAVILSAGALATGVAACGSSSSSASPAASTSSSAAASSAPASSTSSAAASTKGGVTKLSIGVMGHMLAFTTKQLTAKAGTVEISFSNASGEGHNLTVQKGTGGATIGATPTFSSGTHTLKVHLSPGTYTYYCSVPGHREAGMAGTLTVS